MVVPSRIKRRYSLVDGKGKRKLNFLAVLFKKAFPILKVLIPCKIRIIVTLFAILLNIVYRVLTLANGEIKVESEYGKGTAFTVTLPKT